MSSESALSSAKTHSLRDVVLGYSRFFVIETHCTVTVLDYRGSTFVYGVRLRVLFLTYVLLAWLSWHRQNKIEWTTTRLALRHSSGAAKVSPGDYKCDRPYPGVLSRSCLRLWPSCEQCPRVQAMEGEYMVLCGVQGCTLAYPNRSLDLKTGRGHHTLSSSHSGKIWVQTRYGQLSVIGLG